MPLKTESLEEPGGRVIVSGWHQTSASLTILPKAAQATALRNISVSHNPRSQES
jgi:hypothetical protein